MSDSIPQDVLIEILLKLPVKSIIRSLSVCKEWQSLIKSPLFASLNLANAQNHLLVELYDLSSDDWFCHYLFAKGELASRSIKQLNSPIRSIHDIKGSCNGLLCSSIQFSSYNPKEVSIWNPCTRNHVVLPQPLTNPSEINRVLLGFGVANNVYKVVRLVYNIVKLKPAYLMPIVVGSRAEIFTLGTTTTTTWRKLSNGGIDIVGRVRPNNEYCWFFNGFMHWIVFESMDQYVFRNSILTFHVGDEVFGEIKLPEELNISRHDVETLAVIGESFGLVDYHTMKTWFDVWIMKDYGVTESWTKLYRIDCERVKSVAGFLESSELVLLQMNDSGFVIYNAKTRESKHVGNFGVGGDRRAWYVDDFKESLVLLGGYI